MNIDLATALPAPVVPPAALDPATASLIVLFGRDDAGRPHASRFDPHDRDAAEAAAKLTLAVNRVFAWNNHEAVAAPPDCKPWQEAFTAFEAMRAGGAELTVITGEVNVGNFIAYAYHNGEPGNALAFANLEALVIAPTEGDRTVGWPPFRGLDASSHAAISAASGMRRGPLAGSADDRFG